MGMQHGGDCPSSTDFAQKIAQVDIRPEFQDNQWTPKPKFRDTKPLSY
jgi:hypothetical protein